MCASHAATHLDVFAPSVVRVENQKGDVPRGLVVVNTEQRVGEEAAANHYRRSLRLEMVLELPAALADILEACKAGSY